MTRLAVEAKGNAGYDAVKNEVVADMISAGIVDPVKVARTGLERASSAAAMILTTEAAVAEEPEGPAPHWTEAVAKIPLCGRIGFAARSVKI